MNGGTVTIVIAGQPVAKGRPRVTRKGFAYTPAATRKYEAHGQRDNSRDNDGLTMVECRHQHSMINEL